MHPDPLTDGHTIHFIMVVVIIIIIIILLALVRFLFVQFGAPTLSIWRSIFTLQSSHAAACPSPMSLNLAHRRHNKWQWQCGGQDCSPPRPTPSCHFISLSGRRRRHSLSPNLSGSEVVVGGRDLKRKRTTALASLDN